jgi:hypothetical protein
MFTIPLVFTFYDLATIIELRYPMSVYCENYVMIL